MYLMTPDEAAKVLRVDPETLRRWLRSGEFKAAKTKAGWRISQQDMEQFLITRHTRQPDDDDDAYWAAEADAALDRLERGEDHVITLEQWEARHGLGG